MTQTPTIELETETIDEALTNTVAIQFDETERLSPDSVERLKALAGRLLARTDLSEAQRQHVRDRLAQILASQSVASTISSMVVAVVRAAEERLRSQLQPLVTLAKHLSEHGKHKPAFEIGIVAGQLAASADLANNVIERLEHAVSCACNEPEESEDETEEKTEP